MDEFELVEGVELPYLGEGEAPEGEERNWGYRLKSARGDLFLAPLSGEVIHVSSDCLDVEALADKRGLTPKAYSMNVLLARDEAGGWR